MIVSDPFYLNVRLASTGHNLRPLLLRGGEDRQPRHPPEPRQHVLVLRDGLVHQGFQVIVSSHRRQVEVFHQSALPHLRLTGNRRCQKFNRV